MIQFWIAAGALALGALGFLLVPLWQQRQRSGQWSGSGLAAAAVILPVTLGVYLSVTTWTGDVDPDAALPEIAEMVAGLAQRLSQDPDDATGWRMLGRSYIAIGRYPEARDALREAWARTPVPDTELKLSLAEAEALSDPGALSGEAGRLVDEVLAAEPGNEKALWYGGLAALQSGQHDLVRQRWTSLLAIGVPEGVAEVMREQLAALGQGTLTESVPGGAIAEAAGAFALQLNIRLGDGIASAAPDPGAALFIFARAPEGGPPLVVIRETAAALPGEFALSDANAMLPGRSLAECESLMVVARVAFSGQPTAQPGDLFGELEYRPGEGDGVADLVIDQVVP